MNQTADISNEELKSQIKDIITTDNQTLPQNNDEILYRVSERNPIYLLIRSIFIYIILTPISLFILSSDKVIHILFGALLLFFIIHSFLNTITFKELIIYKDRVIIDKKIFGQSIIKVDDIQYVLSGGYCLSSWMFFQVKKNRLSSFRYCVDDLYVEDECKVEQIIKELIKGEKQ